MTRLSGLWIAKLGCRWSLADSIHHHREAALRAARRIAA